MAIQMNLPKENNYLLTDFTNAYWVIENAGSKIYNNHSAGYQFKIKAYANKNSRDIYRRSLNLKSYSPDGSLVYGAPLKGQEDPALYEWEYFGPIETIFPDKIPSNYDEQITIVYEWVKKQWNLKPEDYLNV